MTQPTPQPGPGAPASRDIVIGATVYGHDNVRFGSVAGSYRNYLIVERGFFMPVDYYVPMAAIERADQDLVVLSISRDAALTQGWERPPFTSETGQRGLRQPAVGRPVVVPASPGASAVVGRQRAADAGTGPTSWPAATADPTPSPDTGTALAGDPTVTQSPPSPSGPAGGAAPVGTDRAVVAEPSGQTREATAVSPSIAFADTYAVGTNTDSYHVFVDPKLAAGTDDPGRVAASPTGEPVVSQSSGSESADAITRQAPDVTPEATADGPEGGNAKPGQ